MSNEELVAQIQAGAVERLGELWEQVEGLVKWKANHIMAVLELRGNCGVEFDDLYQSGYLAMVEAVETYEASAGSFSGWFMYYLKTAFCEATGIRTKKQQKEPLNMAISLEAQITNDADSLLLEIVPDPAGEIPIEKVEARIFHQQMHNALDQSLSTLPADQRLVIEKRYYEEKTLSQVAREIGVTSESVRSTERNGLRKLRAPQNASLLRPFYDFDYYGRSGLGAFRLTGLSVQERYLVIEEERKEREAAHRKKKRQIDL